MARIASRVSRQRLERLAEQLLAVHRGEAPRRVERAGEQAARAGRLDQADAAVDDPLGDPISPPRWSIADWVRLPTILWVEETTRSAPAEIASWRQVGVEAQMRAPGLVDDERQLPGMGHLGEAGDVGAGAEVGGGDDDRADRARACIEPGCEALRGEAVGDAQLRVQLGRHEGRAKPAEH